jgi:hypothetical protein
MTRKVYYVTSVGDVWGVRRARRKRMDSIHMLKDQAIAHAKRLAKAAPIGQVQVHGRNGRVQAEYTYREDPHSTRG